LSIDVFEDQVRRSRRRDAGIDQLRDVWMNEAAEDGTFASEALFGASSQRDVQEFDRCTPIEAAVARSASQTTPMPPWPIGETSLYAPTVWPVRSDCASGSGGCSRKPFRRSAICPASSASKSAASVGCCFRKCVSQSTRASAGTSSTWSRYG